MPETHFDEWIAERYEILWPELFDPAVIDPPPRKDRLGPQPFGHHDEYGRGAARAR
jgi:hypothetical protein